jgi:alcohol dehydrogenase
MLHLLDKEYASKNNVSTTQSLETDLMKAAVFSEYNKDPVKAVKITDIDPPTLKSKEVMIKVESAAFNYNDLWAVWGEPVKIPLPHISGTDIAGTVTEIGSGVTTIKVGDRVVSHANLSCRTCYLCTSGREYDCNNRLVWGFQTGPLWGGFAQFAKLPETNVVKLQNDISFNDAAAIAMVGLTSWHMLVGRAKIVPGQSVLIMGGTSGVGMVGIQIAKLYNCNVIATAGTKEKMDKCLEIGADHAVNHRDADWYKNVRKIAKDEMGEEGIDVVFEHIGKSVFSKAVSLLKMGGTLVSTGATTGYNSNIDLRYLFFRGLNLIGSTQGTKAELEDVIYWTSKGRIRPLIDVILPFGRITDGYKKMASGDHFGKILVTPQVL